MSQAVIPGVVITPLKQMRDDRGAVFHVLRSDAEHFVDFGELYFSIVNPGVIKGWKCHEEMTMNLTVPKGKIKLVLSDGNGTVQEIILGEEADDYKLVTVPPMVWSGFQCLSSEPAIVANCASIPYRAEEVKNLDLGSDQIAYTW